MDKNGYNPSILDTSPDEDYLTKQQSYKTARHEIFFGNGNRAISKSNGFWAYFSPESHALIHHNRTIDLRLKEKCQRVYEETHTREDFMALIGRNYLED